MRVLSGRYELLKPLGRGGMGVVHQARDRELERIVAVKVLPTELLRSGDFRARFRREARAAASLSHPNIAVVHDIGEDTDDEEPVPYLVMELVKGATLAELMRREPPTPRETGQIISAVLEALEHSHGRKVVHRDIKPANIMVHRADGRVRVKVMDFGIARLLSQTATRLTATGVVIGTPSYMSPEQAEGRPADERSDLYSTGCVLYEMLTGRPPFTGDSPTAVLFQHLQKTPNPPSQINSALVPFWDEVITNALAKDPRDRYPDAASMRQTIETGLVALEALIPPPAPPPVLELSTLFDTPPPDTMPPGRASHRPDPSAPVERPLPGASRSDPPASRRHRHLTRRNILIAIAAAGAVTAVPIYLRTPDPDLVHPNEVTSVAFSPDGKTLATGSSDGKVWLWGVATRTPIGKPLTAHTSWITSVAFSPDGKTLATGSNDETVRLWGVATRTPIGKPLTAHTSWITSVAFSPDGKTLATGSNDETVRLWGVATRTPIGKPLTAHTGKVTSVAFSPDGKTLATGSLDGKVWLWNVSTRTPIGKPLTAHTSWITSVAFSPDGKTLATGIWSITGVTGNWDSKVRLWDVSTRTPIGKPFTGHIHEITSVAFSPDGKTLATSGWASTIWLWDMTTHNHIRRPLTGHTSRVTSVAFSPDGKILATGSNDKRVRLWEL
ncbi:protein kinase domain-containing protein [Actinocorallia libanotica]|uniref:protein kinase domain-containing protein n=1 Tax=Actinocorallia libanotica TaxID=46162 RepID=UPI0031D19D3E